MLNRIRGLRFLSLTYLTFIITILIIPPTSSPASSVKTGDYRDASCLKKTFTLKDEVTLGLKCAGHMSGESKEIEETKNCSELILKSLFTRGRKVNLRPWGHFKYSLELADSALNGIYEFELSHSKGSISIDNLWNNKKNKEDNTFAFYIFSFNPLGYLNTAYRETEDSRYIEHAGKIIESFYQNCLDYKKLPHTLSWYDHTVANRAGYLLDFWELYKNTGNFDPEFLEHLIELIWRHGKFLENKNNYNPKSNHGIFSSYSLLRIALEFPEFRDAREWKKLAIKRIEEQIRNNFTPDGLHMEYSPYYHLAITEVLREFREDCRRNGIKLSGYFNSVLNNALRVMPHLLFPDATISLLGDSDETPHEAIIQEAYKHSRMLRYISSGGKSGKVPRKSTIAFPTAKLFIMRSGWGLHRDLKEESCLMANFTDRARSHDHDDFLSFELYAKGKKWVTDLGRWTYEYNRTERKYIVSLNAHNVIVPYCPPKKAKKKSGTENTRKKRESAKPRKIAQLDTLQTVKSARIDTRDSIDKLIEMIGKMKKAKERIEAYRILLNRNPPWYRERIILLLANEYAGSEETINRAMELLDKIIARGEDSQYYTTAVELKNIYREMLKEGTPDKKSTGKKKKHETNRQGQRTRSENEIKLESSRKIDAREASTIKASRTSAGNPGATPLQIITPQKNESPVVYGWRNELSYAYLEGAISSQKNFFHDRAILHIKPHYFLIVDHVYLRCKGKTVQLLHMPSDISVKQTPWGFKLTSKDSLVCLLYKIHSPENANISIVSGRKGNYTNYQGWYSGTFGKLTEAPVIESVVKGPSEYFSAILFVPVGIDNPGDYQVKILNSDGWNFLSETLTIKIYEPGKATTVKYRPSSRFIAGLYRRTGSFDPLVKVKRRKR